ncbi:Gfo/Idh/MocA family protein [Mesorhizobium ventifaucium]
MSGVRLLGAHDESPLLRPFVDALGLEPRSKDEILTDADVHAVLVHPKSHAMADFAIEALEAGKAVLCEKPAGRGSADTARIVAAVNRTDGLFQVGYCWRFAPSIVKMQEVLASGRLGKVLQVRAHAGCSHNEAATAHMNQPGDIGGAMFVIACHLTIASCFTSACPMQSTPELPSFRWRSAPSPGKTPVARSSTTPTSW